MKDRNITAIISARTGSSRLPNKVLLDISGKTALERMVERVKNAKTIDVTITVETKLITVPLTSYKNCV